MGALLSLPVTVDRSTDSEAVHLGSNRGLTLSLLPCVILGELLTLSVLPFQLLKNDANSSTCFIGLLWKLNKNRQMHKQGLYIAIASQGQLFSHSPRE